MKKLGIKGRLCIVVLIAVAFSIVSVEGANIISQSRYNPLSKVPVIEAGTRRIRLNDFLLGKDKGLKGKLVKGLNYKESRQLGRHKIVYKIKGRKYEGQVEVRDTKAPVIKGVRNLRVKKETSVSYRKGVYVKDNCDNHPTLTINTDGVSLNQPGRYKVTYIAEDATHNKSQKSCILTVYEETDVKKLTGSTMKRAYNIISSITNESDSKEAKLQKAFSWCMHKPYRQYRAFRDTVSWPSIYADDFFVKGGGDCHSDGAAFAYLAAAIGYHNVYAVCDLKGGGKGVHSWTEIDGRVYDALFAKTKGMSRNYNASYASYGLVARSKRKIA